MLIDKYTRARESELRKEREGWKYKSALHHPFLFGIIFRGCWKGGGVFFWYDCCCRCCLFVSIFFFFPASSCSGLSLGCQHRMTLTRGRRENKNKKEIQNTNTTREKVKGRLLYINFLYLFIHVSTDVRVYLSIYLSIYIYLDLRGRTVMYGSSPPLPLFFYCFFFACSLPFFCYFFKIIIIYSATFFLNAGVFLFLFAWCSFTPLFVLK